MYSSQQLSQVVSLVNRVNLETLTECYARTIAEFFFPVSVTSISKFVGTIPVQQNAVAPCYVANYLPIFG